MTARRVVVIGGGLAGISAAIRLREAGVAVTLLEASGPAWRGDLLVHSRRPDHRQRPARLPAVLHRLP